MIGSSGGFRTDSFGVFSPTQGLLTRPGSRLTAETLSLLRTRLRAVTLLILLGAAAFLARRILVGVPLPWTVHSPLLLLGLIVAILYSRVALSLWSLRTIEVATFWGLSSYLVYLDHLLITQALRAGGPDTAVAQAHLAVFHAVALILAYAVFIPNNGARAALIILPMATAPVLLIEGKKLLYPEIGSAVALDPAARLRQGSVSYLLLALVVIAVVYGTHVIHRYRVAAVEADEVGQYHLEKRIGRGGMGEVWLAEHRMLVRPAAIKLIRPEMLGSSNDDAVQLLRRFEREAQATATLTSPHTVQLYDFGISQDGVFYYVMEYLDGLDLETLVKKHGPVQPERAIHILRQACESLADAHDHGLVHRDVKPANVFTCRLGRTYDFVKVLDFGLVKWMPTASRDVTQLTMQEIAAGTPAFMPPELATGAGTVDARADLYALGCVAYWLVTGQLVFDNRSSVGMVVEHVRSRPMPPSSRTELEVPEELDRVILRCLEKDPSGRFASADELSQALAAVPIRQRWDSRRASEWWSLHVTAAEQAG